MARAVRITDFIDIPQTTIDKAMVMSTEAIAHQHQSPFFKELVSKLSTLTPQSSKADYYKLDLDKTIKKYTNIVTNLEVYDHFNASMYCPDLTANNIFSLGYRDVYTGSTAMDLARNKISGLGGVNRVTGKISGIFEKITIRWRLGTPFIERGFTPEEVASIILHEVGHAFTAFEYAAEIYTTNTITHAMLSAVLGTDNAEERLALIYSGYKELGLEITENDARVAADTGNVGAVYIDVVSKRRDKRISATGTDIYDQRSCEASADQFAARHGAAFYAASWQYKVAQLGEDKALDSRSLYNMRTAFTYICVSCFSLIAFPIGIFILWFYFADDVQSGTYDTTKDRISRMKREIIDYVKHRKLSKSERAEAEHQIKQIEQMESTLSNHPLWREHVQAFFFKSVRQQRARMTMSQLIEEMANNNLFASANSLFHRGE